MNNYIKWLESKGKRDHTIHSYKQIAILFQKWFIQRTEDDSFKGEAVSAIDLQEWKSYLLNEATYVRGRGGKPQRYSVRSVITFIKAIKSYFEYLQDVGVIASKPALELMPPKVQLGDDEDSRWLEQNERNRLLSYINGEELKDKNIWRFTRNKAIIYLGLYAGLRRSEIVDLEIKDLLLEKGYVTVRDGNGMRSRYIPMNTDLRKSLLDWLKQRGEHESDNVFLSQKGGAITKHTLNKMCTAIGKRIDLDNFAPHVLRHTYGYDLAAKGTQLEQIAEWMGHSTVNFTRVYTRYRESWSGE